MNVLFSQLKPLLVTVLHAQYRLQILYETGELVPKPEFDELLEKYELVNSLIDCCGQAKATIEQLADVQEVTKKGGRLT